ncbi:DNA-methyltransferase [Agrobacterium tumefaciens]|uniref:DNA-methyltransferase n=1 Tax=Agrobacterium tumefaciens TaxID=358 RepID=UPI0016596C96|nr:DNA methyltransferase [Agrobacterium tumefaciens]QNP81001.1 site-specific DNA-methyltransferase [Agrobacterium tumefaciens]
MESIGDATLYLGDAMQIMPFLPKSHLAVSDVPYALTTGGVSKSSKTMSGIFAMHNYSNDGQLVMATVPFPDMMAALHAALVDDADCYVMANDKNVHPLTAASLSAGFSFHNLLVWDKVTPTANRWYMKNLEFTLYLWKGRAKTINNPSSKQLIRGGIDKITSHPTEKPVYLMAEYVLNSSAVGETVIDPFMGSGTTGVAALQLGRKFVGIELNEEFFEVACARLRQSLSHPDMFSHQSTERHEATL